MASPLSDSLYVSNLSYNTNVEVLKQSFPGCIDAQIIIDKETGRSKGYGFVRFTTPDDAQKVLDAVGGPGGTRPIDGRDVKINYAHSKDKSGQSQGRGGGFGSRGGGRGGYNRGNFNQGGFNNYNQGQSGYSGGNYEQSGYGGQASYGQQAGYGQGGYGAGGQGNYGNYGGQGYAQTADSSSYGGDQQGQGQNWQQQGQQQNWQQPQQSWPQGQQPGQQYGGGDYQSQNTAAYSGQQQRGNWGGNYQQ